MKCFFVFVFGLFFGFFDFMYLSIFLFALLIFLFFDMGAFIFMGVFFCDSISFFLIFLSFLIMVFCFYSSLYDYWLGVNLSGFIFVLSSIFFLLFLSFVSFSVLFFYVCFELIFMFMYFFVLLWGQSPERLQASFYMVFYTILVSFPFLFYVIFFESFFMSLKFLFFHSLVSYWWFFLFFVFLVKLPVYGVHLWLPKAHVEAPVSGSMVLAGVLLKLGGYGFLRFSFFSGHFLFLYSGYLFSVGLVGGLFSCFLCMRQFDLKSFVAYSSVCHMGFCLSGLYTSSFFGFSGGVYMLIAHGFCSSCLFYILYVFYERYHSRSLFVLKGVGYVVPFFIMSWFVFSVLNMGVPPSFSFFSEVLILVSASGFIFWSFVFSALFLFFAGLYGIFLYVVSCHGPTILPGSHSSFFVREYLNVYGHFYPLLFLSFFVGGFYF